MEAARQNMTISRVCDVASGIYFPGDKETLRPGYLVNCFGERVSRVKILGTVTDRFMSQDGRFASLTVDDGTGAVRIRVFSDGFQMIESFNQGDLVSVVGKVKSYNEENYVSPESVRRMDDPNSEQLFRLEVLERIVDKKRIADELRGLRDQMSDEEIEDYASQKYGIDKEVLSVIFRWKSDARDDGPAVLELISKLDDGNGADIAKLLEASKLDESMFESAISDLITRGEIYEPVVGRLKRV